MVMVCAASYPHSTFGWPQGQHAWLACCGALGISVVYGLSTLSGLLWLFLLCRAVL